ncbi:MAG: carotenoid biosynthesis protein [Candidatus Thorarchaeota archaeon]
MDKDRRFMNLMLIVFSIAFFLSSWLVANVDIGEAETWVSAVFIVVLAVPSFYFVIKWLGAKKGIILILIFAVLPIVVEAIGISTGIPYGGFHYTDQMGYKILGLVPWSVAFAFGPLVFGCLVLAARFTKNALYSILLSAFFLVVVDLVLDPAAVLLGIWIWDVPGPYYGIPITNYVGWFITASIASAIMHLLTAREPYILTDIPVNVSSSLLITIAFWTGYCLWTGLLIPLIIGLLLLVLIIWIVTQEKQGG